MKKNIMFLLLFFIALPFSPSFGQNNTEPESKFNPETLIPDVHGLMQIWGKYGVSNLDESTFMMKRMEISFSGDVLPGKIGYATMIDPISKTKVINEAGKETHTVSVIMDMFMFFKFADFAKLTVGQFLYPITREGLTPSGDLLFAERSMVGRIIGDKRDIGIQVSGQYAFLKYAVALINGNGQDFVDNNNYKDLSARLVFIPIKGLEFGGYAYTGKNTVKKLNSDKKRFGFEFEYKHKLFGVIAEYAQMEDFNIKSTGYYGSAYYNIMPNLYAAARYEGWDPDDDTEEDNISVITFGLGYYLYDNHLKFHADYTSTEHKNQNSVGEIIVGTQIGF